MWWAEVNILVKKQLNNKNTFSYTRWQKNKGTPMCNLQTKMAKKSPRKMSNALDKVHFSAWPDATLLLTQIWLRLSNHYCMTGPFTHGTFQKSIVQQKVVHGTFLETSTKVTRDLSEYRNDNSKSSCNFLFILYGPFLLLFILGLEFLELEFRVSTLIWNIKDR